MNINKPIDRIHIDPKTNLTVTRQIKVKSLPFVGAFTLVAALAGHPTSDPVDSKR